MPPSRWSLTSGRLQTSKTLLFSPQAPPTPPKKSLGRPCTGYVTPSSYAFKSHPWWQTRDIPRHSTSSSPLSAIRARSCTIFRIGNQQAGPRVGITRVRLRYFCCTTFPLQQATFPQTWYPKQAPKESLQRTLGSLTPYLNLLTARSWPSGPGASLRNASPLILTLSIFTYYVVCCAGQVSDRRWQAEGEKVESTASKH